MSKNNLCTIYIARHGQTEWNALKLIQGHKDSPQTALGEKQAKELSKNLVNVKFDAIYSSDLLRSKRTAEIIALERKTEVKTAEVLRERLFGKLEGKPKIELDNLLKLEEVEMKKAFERLGIEDDDSIISRVLTFIREIAVFNPGKKVLVISHGGVLRVLLVKLGWAKEKELGRVRNTTYIKLRTDGAEIILEDVKGVERA